jgi:hypothetical protein
LQLSCWHGVKRMLARSASPESRVASPGFRLWASGFRLPVLDL